MKKSKKLLSLLTPLAIAGATAPVVLTSCSNSPYLSVATCNVSTINVCCGGNAYPEIIMLKAKFYDKDKKEVSPNGIIWNYASPSKVIPGLSITINSENGGNKIINGQTTIDAKNVSDAFIGQSCTFGFFANTQKEQLPKHQLCFVTINIFAKKA